MHEVAMMQGMVTTVLEKMQEVGAKRVTQVDLTLGVSDHFTEDAARQHFAILTSGTPAENATLRISWLPATYQCFTCRHTFPVMEHTTSATCPECGGLGLEIAHEDACYVTSIEVENDGGTINDE